MPRFALMVLSLTALTGCLSLDSAVETASAHSCDYANRCGAIGPGRTYVSYSDCMTHERVTWLDTWPASRCDAKLDADKFDVCMKAWEIASCGNVLDTLSTYSKCSSSEVCSKK